LRIERDRGKILQRRVVAQARGGKELIENRLLGSARARSSSGEDGQRNGEQDGCRASRPMHNQPPVGFVEVRIFLFVVFFDQSRDRNDLIIALDIDELYALRRPSDRPYVIRLGSQNHALLGDQQQ